MEGTEFDRTDLAWLVAEKTGINPIQVIEVLKGIGQVLPGVLAEHGRAEIHELGTFNAKKRNPDHGVLPGGGNWERPGGLTITFKAWTTVKRALSEKTQTPVF